MTDDRLYLYAIISDNITFKAIQGIDDAEVKKVSYQEIAAIVSQTPEGKIRPQRKHLAAHQHVLKALMEQTTPIPVHFGMIAAHHSAIEALLNRYQQTFREQLHYIDNKIEMGLRVSWNVPNIFEYVVNSYPELQALRDRAFNGGRQPARDEMIVMGSLFNQLLENERETHTQVVEAHLNPICTEIKRTPHHHEHEIMNLVCLLNRDHRNAFEHGIYDTAKTFSDDFLFDFNGPWAPHHFVDITIHE